MAVRTIKVDITGLKEIEKAQKSVSALRDSVLDFEKKLGKMGGKNTSPLSFNVKLMFNTDKALKDYLALKKQIEAIPIQVSTKKGTSTGGTSQDTTVSGRRERTFSADYIKVKDQDYQSWRNLHKAIQDVSSSTFSLSSQMLRLGAVNPAKGLLGVFNKVNSTILGIQGNLMGLVGNKITGAIGTAVQSTLGAVRGGIGQLKDEANNLGDAMQVYRINMQALGFDEKSVNKSIKRLGDYGKSTVFDATDLLEQASTYTAYGRKDAEQIVKGYAGLLAQTKNPIEGMKTVTEQTSQMLASGVLNQQDYKFIRQRLSALGASRLNAELQKLAESKGADSIISATKKRLISADEYLDVVNKLGNEDTFQNLVNSIITPRQAIANLKETLSNLLVFDDIDEEGNAKPGALNQVYVATRDFIKGITEIVGTDKFKEYVTRLGNAIGGTIQQVNQFGSAWKLAFSKQFTDSIEHFVKAFNEGVKGLDVGTQFFNVTKSFLGVLNNTGRQFGTFVRDIVKSGAELAESLAKLASQAITGGALRVLSGIVDIYNNIAKLAVNSEAVRIVSSLFLQVTDTINTVVKSINPSNVNAILTALKSFVGSITSTVAKIATKTNIFNELTNVVKGVLEALSDIVLQVGTFRPSQVNGVLESLRKAILGIVTSLKPLIVELGRGALNVLSSASGQNFFNALQEFVKSVVGMIRNILISIGGSVEGGLKAILNFFTLMVNTASSIAKVFGGIGKYLIAGALVTKFLTWATSIIQTLATVATAMNTVSGGRVNPLGLAGAFGTDSLARQGITSRGVNTSVAYSGMSRVAKNASANNPYGMSRVARNKARTGNYAKGLGLLGAQIAVDSINVAVQNSDMNQDAKNFSNVLTSGASWASTGALIGSAVPGVGTAVGALVGGAIGLGAGMFSVISDEKEAKKREQEAKKQAIAEARKLNEEQLQQNIEAVKQLANETAQIRNSFYSTLSKDSSITDKIHNANSLIEATKNSNEGSIDRALKELNIQTASVPQNIEKTFIKIGDQVKSWSELKQETGIEDNERLLQTLQLVKSALGEKVVEFFDSEGNKIAEDIRSITPEESNRQSVNLDTYKAQLDKIKLSVKEGTELIFKDITTISTELDGILKSRNYANKEEQAKAIREALDKVGIDTSKFVELSVTDQINKASELVKQGNLLGGTREQQTVALAEALKNRLGEVSVQFQETLTKGLWDDLSRLSNLIDTSEELSKMSNSEEKQKKVQAYIQSITKLLKDGELKVAEAQALFDKAGIQNISAENLKAGVTSYKLGITYGLDAGKNKFLEGAGIIGDANIPGISTSGITSGITGLKIAVKDSISSAIAKLDEAIAQAKASKDWDEVNALANERQITEYAKTRRNFQTGGLIPEYHSEGLPVGINWKRRGTDTVPTMLTPGEYVLRKKAVDSLGTNFLNNLNKFGVNALQSVGKSTIINNVYNTNNAKISQNIDNKSQYLNGMFGVDKLMRYV